MISLILSIAVLFSVPYFYEKSVRTKSVKLSACSKPSPDLFSEARRLSGHKLDRTKVGVILCVIFILLVYLYQMVYTGKAYTSHFSIVDTIALSFLMVSWPIFGLSPLRFGHILIDQVHVSIPKIVSVIYYPREFTSIWIHQIGNETYACVLQYKQQSDLLFLDKKSANLLRSWAMC